MKADSSVKADPRSPHGRDRRLVLLVAGMTFGPLLVLDAAALRLSADAASDRAERQVASAAAATAVAVQREVGGLADLVESFARRPSLIQALGGGGAVADRDAVRGQLAHVRDSTTGIDLVFVADVSGVLVDIVPDTPSLIGRDFSFRDWYRGVSTTRAPYVSEVHETPAAGGGRVVAAAAPIRSTRDGESPWTGILVAGYRIARIQRFVDDFAAAQGVSLTVTDQRGVAMASPDAGPMGPATTRPDAGVSAALEGRPGSGEADRGGEEVVTAHAPVPGLGWAVVADLPRRDALGGLRGLRVAIVALTGGLALVLVAGLVALDRALRRRAEAQDELRRSRSLLDSVVENIPDMVFVKDASDLRYVRLNRAGEELLGCERDEVVGRSDDELFPADAAGFSASQDREVLDGRRLVDIPVEQVQTRGRGERLVHTRRIPILSADGSPQYLLGISEDVTDRRRAGVAPDEAREAADRANRAKDQFSSRVSHERRTPPSTVLGFGQMLQLDDLRPEQRDSVEHIARAGAHLLERIDDVLDVSGVETGQMRLSLEPVGVAEVVAEAVGMVRPLAATARVRLQADLSGCQGHHVRADRRRLRQVVVNLVSNAVRYNRAEGRVAVRCEPAGPGLLRLVVADTGVGVAASDLARLFRPFERLGAEQAAVEGTGRRLALTTQLVDVMGGTVAVTSEVGAGTTFFVELALVEAPRGRATGEEPGPGPVAVPGDRVRTVLYVEDDASNVKLVERVVALRPGVRLMVAVQGGTAVDLACEHRPDLILLDLHLPDMSGEEVLRRLKADTRTAPAPVVVLSADATTGQIERLLADGAADYLTKPFDIPRMLEVIDGTTAAGAGGGHEPPAPADPAGGPLDAATLAGLDELAAAAVRGRAGVADAVSTFLEEAASRLASLRVAVAHGDARGAERLAHSLAGSSATFGARLLAEQCRALELAAAAGDLDGAPSLVGRLEDDFAVAAAALRDRFLDGHREHGGRA